MLNFAMANDGPVIVDVDGAVAHVQLNRPDKLNALDSPMFEGLVSAGKRLMSDADIRKSLIQAETPMEFYERLKLGEGKYA